MQTLATYPLSDGDFDRLRLLVRGATGISLSEQKRELVYGRLARRLRALGLGTFSAYCDYLESRPDRELQHFRNAITTNLTAFFREPHHFEMLGEGPLHQWLMQRLEASGRLRIWSAGCSTGEEPFSIAMALAEHIPEALSLDIKILATDLDTNVLEVGRSGIYLEERIQALSPGRVKRWFQRGTGPSSGKVRVVEPIRRIVTFNPLNLMSEWPMRGLFDVVFCRNVLIYFDAETQERLLGRFALQLQEGGGLFLGHSETTAEMSSEFTLQKKTAYRKRARG